MPDRESLNQQGNDRQDAERNHFVHVRNDILWFCNAMGELVMQVREWLRGSGVSSLPSVILLTDESVRIWPDSPPASYEIHTLSLKRRSAEAEIIPLFVYGEPGARGMIQLTITSRREETERRVYLISLNRKLNRWYIREKGFSPEEAIPLIREEFIKVLYPLLSAKKKYPKE